MKRLYLLATTTQDTMNQGMQQTLDLAASYRSTQQAIAGLLRETAALKM